MENLWKSLPFSHYQRHAGIEQMDWRAPEDPVAEESDTTRTLAMPSANPCSWCSSVVQAWAVLKVKARAGSHPLKEVVTKVERQTHVMEVPHTSLPSNRQSCSSLHSLPETPSHTQNLSHTGPLRSHKQQLNFNSVNTCSL